MTSPPSPPWCTCTYTGRFLPGAVDRDVEPGLDHEHREPRCVCEGIFATRVWPDGEVGRDLEQLVESCRLVLADGPRLDTDASTDLQRVVLEQGVRIVGALVPAEQSGDVEAVDDATAELRDEPTSIPELLRVPVAELHVALEREEEILVPEVDRDVHAQKVCLFADCLVRPAHGRIDLQVHPTIVGVKLAIAVAVFLRVPFPVPVGVPTRRPLAVLGREGSVAVEVLERIVLPVHVEVPAMESIQTGGAIDTLTVDAVLAMAVEHVDLAITVQILLGQVALVVDLEGVPAVLGLGGALGLGRRGRRARLLRLVAAVELSAGDTSPRRAKLVDLAVFLARNTLTLLEAVSAPTGDARSGTVLVLLTLRCVSSRYVCPQD